MNNNALTLSIALLIGGFAGFSTASAATINVAAGDVAINAGNASCSLREAIVNAESDSDTSGGDCAAGSGTDTIELTQSTYVLTDVGISDLIYGESGLPAFDTAVIMNGHGSVIERSSSLFTSVACDGGTNFRIAYVGLVAELTLNDITLRNGCASFINGTGAGGAIFNRGALNLNNVVLTNHEASNSGGAIHSDGELNLIQSTVSNSRVLYGAGGGIVNRGNISVVQSTINGNRANGSGGGLETTNITSVVNSTIGENETAGSGGGIFTFSNNSANIINSTIAMNNAPGSGQGSGIFSYYSPIALSNTIVAGNMSGSNCFQVTDSGSNLDDDASCSGTSVGDVQFGSLSDNGGPTQTYPLFSGSAAIGSADSAVCSASPVNGVDQRGVSRPALCDKGAYQTSTQTSVTLPDTITYVSTVTESDGVTPVSSTLSIVPTVQILPLPPAGATSLVTAFDLTSQSNVAGYKISVTFDLGANSPNEFLGFWKYGREILADSNHWYDYGTLAANGDDTGYTISADKKSLTIYLVDGLRGDDDLTIDAFITDPGLLVVGAAPIYPVPTLSFWGVSVLMGLIGLIGFRRRLV